MLGCLDWLLACQHRQVHPFTGAAPGGWGWTDLSGAVPDADDTPGALLALAAWRDAPSCSAADRARIDAAAAAGIGWLLDLQNRDGGWPTFCRGWGQLPFDRSGADLTAHALRALQRGQRRSAGRRLASSGAGRVSLLGPPAAAGRQLGAAVVRQPGPSGRGESRSTARPRCCWPIATGSRWTRNRRPAPSTGCAATRTPTAAGAAVRRGPRPAAGTRQQRGRDGAGGGGAGGRGLPGEPPKRRSTEPWPGWSTPSKRTGTATHRRSGSTSPSCGTTRNCTRCYSRWRPSGK